MNVDVVWNNLLSKLKEELSSLSYDTWFGETTLYSLDNGKAKIIVPMPIHKKHLQDQYLDIISSNLNSITGNEYEVEFLLSEEIELEEEKEKEKELNADNKEVSKEEYVHSNLNSKYTFENFVVGNSNKLAYASALSIAENPGKTMYNPLFLYGNSGLGKTHLMHAIGNYISENSNKKVLYITCDQFIDDYKSIMRKGEDGTNLSYLDFFKDKYRNIDVLIIDDIQNLETATKTQNEFFNTFNSLHNDSKQIIISSDRSPDDFKKLEDRLRTRFCWGLTANIYPPDFELRKQILIKKLKGEDVLDAIPEEVIDYMASNIGPSVRQLEGAINRLIYYAFVFLNNTKDHKITLDVAIEALPEYVNNGVGDNDKIHRIQRIVSEYFQISVDDIKSKKRNSNISFPRQIAMYLCRNCTEESFPKIGLEFGGKDHSTVIHSVEKIENEIKVNTDLAQIIEKLKKDIGVV